MEQEFATALRKRGRTILGDNVQGAVMLLGWCRRQARRTPLSVYHNGCAVVVLSIDPDAAEAVIEFANDDTMHVSLSELYF